ncbi:alpha/beta hydrolase [Frankia sp. AgB1.9]|uniref:alpha/beta hydrolase n=1 Tax=unclassified Frankia TaxID=2632575 RepID=UPI001932E672|nr:MULTISPECIES: alpha/beta hydrolase [unclassified Frankia]MBL7489408.1 alpha/beta hydrolase [Frankia sp. AgW1.1]MBL7550657.1 alpha/beta hydrolase [Frankia sp. AgB1.9]MBL7620968.1 alpha/beta hydrolase [Frankia sp. AgB1.8]
MAPPDNLPALAVPAREIPVPTSVSPQARAVLAMGPMDMGEYPAQNDADAWRAMIKAADDAVLSMLLAQASGLPSDVQEIDVAGVRIYTIRPQDLPADDRRVFLDVHGGALVMGGGECCRLTGAGTAARVGATVWAVDYRMPPDHPYPAALDDCVAAYRALLEDHRPDEIIVGGASAGGNLAAALILRARDEGLPLPAAAVLNTPEVDLTESGDTFQTNLGVDTVLTRSAMPASLLYAAGHDLADPYLSPLFGDLSKGFPPTLLASGTRDLLLSNTVRMHRALRKAGVPADLHVLEAAPHAAFFGTAPEDGELDREVRRFVDAHWGTLA